MTLLPHDNWDVVPVRDRQAYKVAVNCYVPGCTRFTAHSHHLWRRSHGTNEAWVCLAFLPDRPIVGNLVGLCWEHHNDITGEVGGHKARIWFDDVERIFRWVDDVRWQDDTWLRSQNFPALKFQPPGLGAHDDVAPPAPAADDSESPEAVLAGELEIGAALVTVYVTDPGDLHDLTYTMHRAAKVLRARGTKKKKTDDGLKPLAARKKKTWTVKVPDDSEDGYDVLDTLVDAASEKLGRGDESGALTRYFTVVEALVFLLQHEVDLGE